MDQRPFDGGWIVRLETGEEIVSTLAAFCERHQIGAGTLGAIGAVSWAEVGWYDYDQQTYHSRRLEGGFEVLSLKGNVSRKEDGSWFPHLHIVLGDRDLKTFGGHLFAGEVSATCECYIWTVPGTIHRRRVGPAGSLELLDL